MSTFLELIEEADICATPMLILILVCVGAKMVAEHTRLRQWGLRLAAGSFIAYSLYGGLTKGPTTAKEWVDVLICGFVASGIVLGVAWIFLAGAVNELPPHSPRAKHR